jgi:hypothetical protein
MLVSRRKRKEPKAINVSLNNRLLEQDTTMKYLGIIIDNKFKFKGHITYAAERCTKLIHTLSRSAKLTWGIKHETLKSIYKGAILPLLLYGAPVWIDAMMYEHLAIIKALEAIESINATDNSPLTVTVFTDSRITLDSLQNANNHAYLIEEIRKRVSILEGSEWKI